MAQYVPVPYRLELLRRLTSALEEISFVGSDGVEYRLAGNVFRGRVKFGDDDELPLLSILEVPQQEDANLAGRSGSESIQPFDLVVQGFIADDSKNPTDPAHYFLAAVKQKLVEIRRGADEDDYILGLRGYADTLSFNGGVVRPPDETSSVAHFWLTVYFGLAEDLSAPYYNA